MTEFSVTMQYWPCPACKAPVMSPHPDNCNFDLIKVGPPAGPVAAYARPHLPDCEEPLPEMEPHTGTALRMPGRHVADVLVRFS